MLLSHLPCQAKFDVAASFVCTSKLNHCVWYKLQALVALAEEVRSVRTAQSQTRSMNDETNAIE